MTIYRGFEIYLSKGYFFTKPPLQIKKHNNKPLGFRTEEAAMDAIDDWKKKNKDSSLHD